MDIKQLLSATAQQKGSDLHLVFNVPPKIRKDGDLKFLSSGMDEKNLAPLSDKDLILAAKSLLNEKEFAILESKRDLDVAKTVNPYRFRMNFSYDRGHLKIVARVIDEHKPTLDELGMPEAVRHLLDLPQGLVLITGPTGCGKSTTLAAMVNYLNTERNCHIITLEDPIEYVFTSETSLVSQRELGSDMLSFTAGLNHALRQDPDVIMVGEMRDLETISTAVTLAETGHLVLATLHTYNAAQTIDRIIDIFPSHQQNQIRSQLSMTLAAVVSQRLLPRRSGGRIAAREIMIRNSAIANLIRENKVAQIKTVIETSSNIGMTTMDHHLKELYQAGEIEREDALNYMEENAFLDS
ncbi:MAG: PilT/PilU family type 4a pilus ATPase [Patescibacteria group bacterium]|nr:PilT/PilU family type 4a pilus ATPase [Patescibacteria group bacterium]